MPQEPGQRWLIPPTSRPFTAAMCPRAGLTSPGLSVPKYNKRDRPGPGPTRVGALRGPGTNPPHGAHSGPCIHPWAELVGGLVALTYRLTANRVLPLLALPAGRGALFPGGHLQVDRTLGCPGAVWAGSWGPARGGMSPSRALGRRLPPDPEPGWGGAFQDSLPPEADPVPEAG